MAEQTENASANQPLNKARWMQALDELVCEYIAFQTPPANSKSTKREANQRE
jgi:hypothetical protein